MTQQNMFEDGIDFGDPTLNATEEDIMGGLGDEPNEDADATPPAEAQDDAAEPTVNAAPQDDAGTGQEPDAQLAEQPKPVQAEQGNARPDADKDGNLVDAKGNVIASAGRERRIFEQNERMRRHVSNIERENAELKQAAQQINQIVGMPAQHGLQPQEVQMGMQIMGEFKKDPVSVAKWALKETLSMGYNLQQIVGEGDNSVEMQAIAKMIDDRVGPVVQERQQQTQQQAAQRAAQEQYDAFMAKHEYASVHEDAIAQLIDKDASLTPETAYWRLREYAARHALDFTQPLGQQLQARRAPQAQAPASAPAPQQPAPANVPPQAPQTAPMPVGASPVATTQQTEPTFANPNDDWDDIIAGSMRAAGM